MPRYIIPKGAYDQTQGNKFESTTVNFKVMLVYDQKSDNVCENFAQNSNDALNDLSDLGVYIDVGRPLRIDQTASGGSNVDPVLKVYSAGSVDDPTASGAIIEVPMVCEGWSARESKQAKMWEFSAVYKAVSYENPGHVSAKISSRPRTTPAWRIGDTTAIQWSQAPIVPNNNNCVSPYNDVVQLGDISGIPYDINTQPRNFTVDGLQATFSFVIRAPYYATHQATSLTVDPLWTEWTEGPSARTPGKRSCGTEWGESPAETWPRGEWIVESVQITPINTVDHKVTVTMRTDDFQLCDQIPAQAYGGPVIPKVRPDQPSISIPNVTEFLLCAEYVFWVNPYPMQREVFTAAEFPFGIYSYISESLVE